MKKLFLLAVPFALATAAMAQEITQIEREKWTAKLEQNDALMEVVQNQQALEKLNSYVQAILQTGKETMYFSKDYTATDVLEAMLQAHESEEIVGDPEIYVAEEFLQYMREHFYTQTPADNFSDAFTPNFIAKVLRILK